jgi:hypothetical protein
MLNAGNETDAQRRESVRRSRRGAHARRCLCVDDGTLVRVCRVQHETQEDGTLLSTETVVLQHVPFAELLPSCRRMCCRGLRQTVDGAWIPYVAPFTVVTNTTPVVAEND